MLKFTIKFLFLLSAKRFPIALILVFIHSNLIISQTINELGSPFVKNFSKKEIKNGFKVFDISQDDNGEIYFAKPGFLMQYDGFSWRNYSTKDQSDLRAVLYDDTDHIYTAGIGGFGFWFKNDKGILEYSSLYFKYPTKKAPLLPVFLNIVSANGVIYFQSFQQIYIYNPNNSELNTVPAIKGFSKLFSSNDRVFVQDVSIGLFEIIDNQKKIIKGSENLSLNIIEVFETKKKGLIIATKNNGFWFLENGLLKKKQWKINTEIEKSIVTDVEKYINDLFIVGTLRDGFYIISNEGQKLAHFNKNNGISNNAIRKIFVDNNHNIWLGTESGISYLELNSNTKYLLDNKSGFGTVYTSFLKGTSLYLGTYQGLFVKDIKNSFSEPKLVNNSAEQIWNIDEVDGQLIVGSDKGLSVVRDNSLETIHLEGGAWTFVKHPKIENLMYVGFYSGVAVFKKTNNQWNFIRKFENFGESSRFLEFDQYNQMWVAHPSKGYYRLKLTDNATELIDVEFYGVENKNISTYSYFCKIDGNLVFYNPEGFFFYDALDNEFIKATYPSEIFKGLKNINYILQDENIFWYSTPNFFGYVFRNGNDFNKIQEPFYTIWNRNLKDFNNVKKINKSIYALGIDNGMIFHDIDKILNKKTQVSPIIKSLQFISSKDTITASVNLKNDLKIPYSNNFLKIRVAIPKSSISNSRQFQYKLSGLENEWSNWVNESEIKFPSLASGNYILEIRAKIEVNQVTESIKIPFYINYPWYISRIAKIIYLLLFFIIFISYRAFLKTKNNKYVQKLKQLEKQKRERQKEKFELEKLATDKELLLLKEKNLNLEIKKKDFALASSTLNNIKKKELLIDLIKDIKSIDDDIVDSSLHYSFKKLIKKIDNHIVDKEDWLAFELHFRNSHSQFFVNLRDRHPDLSSNEIKLSAYLKLNLSSKEIASLMNVAITSIEQSRYRLRKKFNLSKEVNLSNYIQSF